MPSSILEKELVSLAGEMAQSVGLNRSVGQIYALLYVGERPLSLGEVADRLGMSKGNASINLRALESWGAVKIVWVDGSRRDHYEADRDIKSLFLRRLREGGVKRLGMAQRRLEAMAGGPARKSPEEDHSRRVAQDLLAFVRKLQKLLDAAPFLAKIT